MGGAGRRRRRWHLAATTTLLAGSPAAREIARRSRRFVHSDCRVVDLVRRTGEESTAQLAAEIVLRTSAW